MKKILFFIGFILFFTDVYAFESGVWTDEVINDPNVLIRESEIRYKWYENVVEFSPDYYVKGENDKLYPNIYQEDFIETEFSEWNEERPLLLANRTIEERYVRRYRTLRPIRYLFFENFKGGYLTYKIAELNIRINDQKIGVKMTCINCSPNFNIDVSDGLDTSKAYINNGGRLMIDLGAYYGIEQIKIEIFMYDATPGVKRFDLYFNEGDTLLDRNYARKEISSYVVSANIFEPEKYVIMADATFIVNPIYGDWIYISGARNNTYYQQMQFLNEYRFKDIKYRYYKNNHIYLDEYYSKVDDDKYIKDEDSATTFYLYEYKLLSNEVKNEIPTQNTNKIIKKRSSSSNNVVLNLAPKNDNKMPTDDKTKVIPVTDNKIVDTNNDLIVINDNTKDRVNNKAAWLNKFNYKILSIWIIIFIMVYVLIRLRHKNLSHQK